MECLLRHGGQSTITGRLLEGSIKVAKAELGLPGKLFSHSASNLSHLITHSWIKDIWHEIQDNEITFREQTPDLQVKQENDQYIMQAALELALSPLQLRMINKCRIYLQVTTFSDLCSGDGFYLLPYYRERFNPLSQFTDLDWPDQGEPNDKCWRLWQKTIETLLPSITSGRLLVLLATGLLKQKLGEQFWIPTPKFSQFDITTNGMPSTRIANRCPATISGIAIMVLPPNQAVLLS